MQDRASSAVQSWLSLLTSLSHSFHGNEMITTVQCYKSILSVLYGAGPEEGTREMALVAGSSPTQPVLPGPVRKEEAERGTFCSVRVQLAVNQFPSRLSCALGAPSADAGALAAAELA